MKYKISPKIDFMFGPKAFIFGRIGQSESGSASNRPSPSNMQMSLLI